MAMHRQFDLRLQNQRSDPFGSAQLYQGIEQPEDSIEGLREARLPAHLFNPDPLGIELKGRGMDVARAAMHEQDPMSMSGPLPDPSWEGFKESLAGKRVRGGYSPQGSNQLTGTPTQPDFLTSAQTFMGRPNQSYKPTMFQPGQTSAVTGHDFNQEQNYLQAIKGLKGAR